MAVKTRSTSKRGKGPWGSTTQAVVEAIQSGANTLSLISQATGVEYRKVNAYVYALECQERVIANNYDLKRCDQTFTVIHADRRPATKEAQGTRRIHPTAQAVPNLIDTVWHKIQSTTTLLQNTESLPTIRHKCMIE